KLGDDLRPVAFELFGDELGEAGESALTHFRPRDADHHGVVGTDHDPDIDFGRTIRRADDGRSSEREIEAEREPGADCGGADDKGTAVHLRGNMLVHGRLPQAFAAAWTASRTCR